MAVANGLSGAIAKLTGVGHEGGAGPQVVPVPLDTLPIYGRVFGQIAIVAMFAALLCLLISPLLKKWMHSEAVD